MILKFKCHSCKFEWESRAWEPALPFIIGEMACGECGENTDVEVFPPDLPKGEV